jgi:hypothetical protein
MLCLRQVHHPFLVYNFDMILKGYCLLLHQVLIDLNSVLMIMDLVKLLIRQGSPQGSHYDGSHQGLHRDTSHYDGSPQGSHYDGSHQRWT